MNKKIKKQAITRIFSLLLAFTLLLSYIVPFDVFAGNTPEDPSTEQVWRVITEDREEKEFPKKDDSVEWVTSDFEITNGKVVSFSSQGYEKFNSNPVNVVVKIPARDKDNMPVTMIGNNAFMYNSNKFKHKMQFVEFPDTLTNIEEQAFCDQDLNFEEFAVPNTWKEVNANAFRGAYFKKLTLTNTNKTGNIYWQGITTPYIEMNGMGEYTVNQSFFSYSNIKHINYGDSKIKLNSYMFNCVNNDNWGNNKAYKTFKVTWNGQKTQADFELPPWENSIPYQALFYTQGLQSVYISNHDSLASIGSYNFNGLYSLHELIFYNIPKLKHISNDTVRYCNSLNKVILKNLPSLNSTSSYFISHNSSLQQVVFENLPAFTSVGPYSFISNDAIKDLNFKNLPSFKSIDYSSICSNNSLTKITFENLPNFKYLGENSGCSNTNLQSINFINMPQFDYIGNSSFKLNPNLKIVTFKDAYIKTFYENAFSDSDIDTLIFDESEAKLDRPLEFQRGAFRNNRIIDLNLPDRYTKDSGASFTNQKFTKVLESKNFKDDPNYKYVDNGSEKYVIITNPIKLTHGNNAASLGTFDTNPYVELLPGPNGEPNMLLKIKGNTKLGETFNATWSNNKLTIPDVRGSQGFIPFTGSVNFSIAFKDLGEVNLMKDNWKHNEITPIKHLRTTPISNDTLTKAVVTASDSTIKDTDIDKKVVFTTIDTFKPAGTKQNAIVRVYFKDGTYQDVNVPTVLTQTDADKFRDDIVNGVIKPEIEIVKQYGSYDLSDNFGKLPNGVTITETSQKVNTAILGDHEAIVNINIPNGAPLTNIKVTVRVIPLDADANDIKVNTIVKTQGTGDKIDLTEGIEGYENLNVAKAETLIPVTDKEVGNFNGKLKLTFKDGSTSFIYVPVQVVPKQIEFNAKTQKVQVYKDHVVTNGDLRDCFLNLPENSEVIDLTEPPVDTSTVGEKAAKVKVILKDGREYEQALIIEVIDPIGILEKKITDNEKQIETITENNEKLVKEIEKLQNQINELTIKLNQANADKLELQNQINTLTVEKERLELLVKQNDELIKDHIESLKKEIEGLKETIKGKDAEIAKLLEKIGTLETKIETITKENTDLKEKLASATEKIKSLEEKIKDLEAQVKDLTDKLNKKIDEVKTLTDKITELEKTIIEKDNQINIDKTEIKELKETIEKLKKELTDKTDEIKKLQEEIIKLKEVLKETQGKNAELEKQVEKLEKEVYNLQSIIKVLNEKLVKFEDENDKLKEKLKEEQDKNSQLEKEKQELIDKTNELQKEKETLIEKVHELELKIQKTESEKETIIREKEELIKEKETLIKDSNNNQEKIKELEEKIVEKDNLIKSLEEQIKDYKDSKNVTQKDVDKLNDRIKELLAKIDELTKALADKTKEAENLAKDKEQYEKDKEEWLREKERIIKENKEYYEKLERELRDKNNDRDKERELEETKQKLYDENRKLEEEILALKRSLQMQTNVTASPDYVTVFDLNSHLYKTFIKNDLLTQAEMTDLKGFISPFISSKRTMLPMRYLALSLGMDVKWDAKTGIATFTNLSGNNALRAGVVTVNAKTLEMRDGNGKLINVDAKPILKDGRFYISITNVIKAFGGSNGDINDRYRNTIEWDGTARKVYVYKNVK